MLKNIILIVGGAGYIGSHITVELLQQGHRVVVIDNLSNSYKKSLENISELIFKKPMEDPEVQEKFRFFQVDVSIFEELRNVFQIIGNELFGVIHLAGLKSVTDSFNLSLHYYNHNVTGSINLFRCMEDYDCKNIIFSSSASVYGEPKEIPIYETTEIKPISVYGDTKVFGEKILLTLAENAKWSVVILRYFNPCGAHESGVIGEHQKNDRVPNLIQLLSEAVLGKREFITIFGKSHPTPDGTPIRDFIHIIDLARGHIAALNLFNTQKEYILNLGTGVGTTVLQAIKNFSQVTQVEIKVKYEDARKGDPPILIANCDKANKVLNWRAEKDFSDMSRDYWKWLQLNPNGFTD